MVERNEINQTNETNQINQLGPPQPFFYTPVVGQTTQNPELITHNFPKRRVISRGERGTLWRQRLTRRGEDARTLSFLRYHYQDVFQ